MAEGFGPVRVGEHSDRFGDVNGLDAGASIVNRRFGRANTGSASTQSIDYYLSR